MKKTRFPAFLLALVLLLSAVPIHAGAAEYPVWDGTVATAFSGSGTQTSPYLISTGAQLALLAKKVTAGTTYRGKYFRLENDLYLNDISDYASWTAEAAPANNWTPIGKYGKLFEGDFDGNRHTVYGLYCKGTNYLGLFSYTGTASLVHDLSIASSKIFGGGSIGSLISTCNGSVSNCHSSAELTVTGNQCAGLVGNLIGTDGVTARISGSSFSGTVQSTGSECGGVVGYTLNTSGRGILQIENCHNSGIVTGTGMRYGGVVANCRDCDVTGCTNTGLVRTNNWCAGGVVGFLYGQYRGAAISRSFNCGTVAGLQWVGGVVGETHAAYGMTNTVASSVNTGSVSGDNCIGGVVGNTCTTQKSVSRVEQCLNSGTVAGNTDIGGVVGIIGPNETVSAEEYPDTMLEVSDCVNVGNVTGNERAGGVCGHQQEARSVLATSYSVGRVTRGDGAAPATAVGQAIGACCGTATSVYGFACDTWQACGTASADAALMAVSLLDADALRVAEGFDFFGIYTTANAADPFPYPVPVVLRGFFGDNACQHAEGVIADTAASCAAGGELRVACALCNTETKREDRPALAHTPSDRTHTPGDGGLMYATVSCTVCGTVLESALLGDSDGDGALGGADAVLLDRYLAGWDADADALAQSCDIDGDGTLTDWDAILLARKLAGWTVSAFGS